MILKIIFEIYLRLYILIVWIYWLSIFASIFMFSIGFNNEKFR